MPTFHAPLVGVNFRPAESRDYVKSMTQGTYVNLVAEPNNAYDPNAVMVMDSDMNFHLGYLARDSNAEVAELLSQDAGYEASVHSHLGPTKPLIEITFDDPDD